MKIKSSKKVFGILLVIICSIIVSSSEVLMALAMKFSLEAVLELDKSKINYLIILFLTVIVLSGVGYNLKGRSSAYYKRIYITSLKSDIINSVMRLNIKDFFKIGPDNISSQLTNDINKLENQYLDVQLSLIQDVISFTFSSIVLFYFNPFLALAVYGLMIFVVFIPQITHKQLHKLGLEFSGKMAAVTSKTKELLDGFEIIKSYGASKKMLMEFQTINEDSENTRFQIGKKEADVHSALAIISLFSFVCPFLIGLVFVLNGHIEPGVLMAVTNLSGSIIGPAQKFGNNSARLKIGKGILDKITSTMDISNKQMNLSSIKIDELKKGIELINVGFAYDEKPVLKNINLYFEKGKKYLIMGESGSGKSTLLKILMNYFDDYEGTVLYDNQDLRNVDSEEMSKIVSLIHQDTFIFNSTVAENITFNSTPNENVLKDVCKQAAIDKFIGKLNNDLETCIGNGFTHLSGGEKQRISIARALYAGVEVILVDEATSALDEVNSRWINEILLNIDKTVIYITHKMGKDQIDQFDELITIVDGEIVDISSPQNTM